MKQRRFAYIRIYIDRERLCEVLLKLSARRGFSSFGEDVRFKRSTVLGWKEPKGSANFETRHLNTNSYTLQL